jgi:arylsulfatase A-like enzyme
MPRPLLCVAAIPCLTRTISHVLLIVAVILGATRVCPADERSTRPPNLVLILVDDLGWRDVGFMGSRYDETPAIDRLAREGVVFTDAYANAPNCAPSRACLLTGQYTPRHGIYTVGSPARGKAADRKLIPVKNRTVLDPKAVTVAELLREAGYRSASIGKWHLGAGDQTGPTGQGFDINIAGDKLGHPRRYFSPYRNPNLPDGPKGEYLTDRLTDEAVAFIERNKDRPFFLYLPHFAVHTPLQARPDLVEHFRNKPADGGQRNPVYAAMVASVDRSVGRIIETLEQLDLDEHTIVIFYSDNGGYAGATSNAPLRGFKGMLHEGGIRVPMVVWGGRRVRGGRTCETPVIGTDLFPTLLDLAGVDRPEGLVLDGESLVPLLDGSGALSRESIFWHFPAYLEAGAGVPGLWRTTPAGAIRHGDWKLIEFFEDGRQELYNLRTDIGERHNLADENPDMSDKLHAELVRWRQSVNAPVPTAPNPEYKNGAG